MNHHFNLLYESWIPVIDQDGVPCSISLRDALVNAQAYRSVSATLPHTNAAILRLLLAVLHRNFGTRDPLAWGEIWRKKQFDAAVLDAYFKKWEARFDLFAEEHPFYQQRHPKVEIKPIQTLLMQIGGGDTYTLFNHILDETTVLLTPAEAALGLITAQAFALAGLCHPQLKLFYTDAPCSRAIVFFVEGKTLFETLMFNLIRFNQSEPFPQSAFEPDLPAWEMNDTYIPERNWPLGYLDYLTWQNRRIQLFPVEKDGRTMVASMTTAPGLAINAEIRNPMHHYRKGENNGTVENAVRVLRFNEERALWRDSHVLLDLRNQAIEPPRALKWMEELFSEGILPRRRLQIGAYGMCTEPGKAKVLFYQGERFEISDELLLNPNLVATLGTALAHAEALRSELGGTSRKLANLFLSFNANVENGHKPDPRDVENLIHHWNGEGLYWGSLETPFFLFLDRLPEDPEKALENWEQELRRAAWLAFNQIAVSLGDRQNALKAVAIARKRMAYGISKVLKTQEG
ncbi:MAG: type I-E CRISPR-associated protein Cse1/CasA [Anaerolineae bacterium]|nr:type I-E CRISPR-associated protein Cse1/CasA [Anaerolineae bacterium]